MLSRRNIRVKVMQIMYALNRDSELDYNKAERNYYQRIDRSYDSYLFNALLLVKVAEFALKDAENRKSKYLPTEADKKFTPILCTNACTQSILKNDSFLDAIKSKKIGGRVDNDITKKLYNDFTKNKEYEKYLEIEVPTNNDHIQALLALNKHMQSSEIYEELIDDHYNSWVDDRSLVIGAIKKTIKSLPVEPNFYKDYLPDDEAVDEFGLDLLYKLNEFDEDLISQIQPTLKNWDMDRVAIIDMILIKMALCEMLYFPTIPTKVTINEYIDISKLYSTPKSKNFINGVLDRLYKQLNKEGKINKEGRGLKG